MNPEEYTILIVDDDERVLGSLDRTFRRSGYNVLTAGSGEEGLKLLRNNKVELIISDMRMPAMSGVGFLEKARETVPDAVRIIITAYADVQAATDAINNVEAFKFILKPWDRYHLEKTVQQGLEHYEATRENRRMQRLLLEQNKELAKMADSAARTTAGMERKIKELEHKLDKLYAKYPDAARGGSRKK